MTLSLAERSHFLRRTCFSASKSLIEQSEAYDTKESLVEWLLDQPLSDYQYPEWYLSPPDVQALTKDERKSLRKEMSKELMSWWQELLLSSSTPFFEQISLFWHNHFVSSIKKVKNPLMMLQQNDLFRQQGLGNFITLVDGMLKDPAMLLYLDNANSKNESPNENLARELLELFTLGEGNYTEFDIKEIARALTGASVNKRTGEYVFRSRWHDSGEKTIFGETGNFSVEDLAELIVKQPACAPFIVTKCWYHFVDDTPDAVEVERIAQVFAASGYELKSLMRELFLSDYFWQSQGQQIKSPVQLIVGTYRHFELSDLADRKWRSLTKNMGQQLFAPPNVKGWPGGKAWYASAAIFYREAFLHKFLRWHQSLDASVDLTTVLAVPAVATLPSNEHESYLALVLADPAYQVQ